MAMNIMEIIKLESRVQDLFMGVFCKLTGKVISVEFKIDDSFSHRRDRETNDIHAFFEIKLGGYFHLRSYTRHMLQNMQLVEQGQVFLTGYRKEQIELTGGMHSLEQKWYPLDPESVASELVRQNPDAFY